MRTRSDGRRTRERIVLAACDVFAERGFRDATHETIAKAAGANKALINHHFGDKKTLYRAVWKRLLDLASREHPISGGLPEGTTAAERLEAHVRSLLTRHYGEGARWQLERLRDLEKVNPTGLVDDIREKHHKAHRAQMLSILKELLGENASRSAISFFETSVLALCRAGWSRPVLPGMGDSARRPISVPRIEALSRQITRFMLVGIEARAHQAARSDPVLEGEDAS